MRALIFAAGLGTRLRPITNKTTKCMVKVGRKPVLEHLVDKLNKAGIKEIIVNLHYKPEQIYKYFGTKLLYFYEPKLLGEAKTEKQLKKWLGDEYILMNGDTLNDTDLKDFIKWSRRFTPGRVRTFDTVYTGITYCRKKDSGHSFYAFKHYWQDIGTQEGLKKARKYYAKT